MLQQSGLADSSLAAEDQHTALARAYSGDESFQHVALADTVKQPRCWQIRVEHARAGLSRPLSPAGWQTTCRADRSDRRAVARRQLAAVELRPEAPRAGRR